MPGVDVPLFAFGYPASIAVIARFVPVVRERRWKWLAVHHLGMAALIAGFLTRRGTTGALVNAGWLVASTAWYAAGARRTRLLCAKLGHRAEETITAARRRRR